MLKHGVGTDNIDIAACTARGIPVLNAPGSNSAAVAELAIGLIFAMARAIPAGHASVTSGGWDRQVGREVGGRTLGIVGLGNIGRLLAQKALGLGMTVVAADPFPDQAFLAVHPVEMLPLERLLARADYVSLHLAGTSRLIDAARLAGMKPGARLLNLARGESRRPRRARRGARHRPSRRRCDRSPIPRSHRIGATRSSATPRLSSCRIRAATPSKRSRGSA